MESYPYGHNGQEKEDEIAGAGNMMSAEYWMYDSRLLRRWNIDPVVKPWESSYACFNNNPILFADPDGLDAIGQADANAGKGKKGDTYTDKNGRTFTHNGELGWVENGQSIDISIANTLGSVIYGNRPSGLGVDGTGGGRIPGGERAPGGSLEPGNGNRSPNNPPRFSIPPGAITIGAAATSFLFFMQGDSPRRVKEMEQDRKNNGYIVLFRGVSEWTRDSDKDKPNIMYSLAQRGIAIPLGYIRGNPHKNPEDHTMSDNYSIWTSWSVYPSVAENFARGPNGTDAGVIMVKVFKISSLTRSKLSITTFSEGEFLVPGVVTGASVIKVNAFLKK